MIELIDSNKSQTYNFNVFEHREIITRILTRSLYAQLNKTTSFWRIALSPRIFYEVIPFSTDRDLNAYRRFEINDTIIEGIGLGYSVDIGTAFITKENVDWYHKNNKVERFNKLRQRSNDRKGTLIYQGPGGYSTCYFEKYYYDLTLATAPAFSIGKEKFESPYDYFNKKHPNYNVSPNDIPAKVSFKGMESAVYVPANKLRLRVFNDVLPSTLKNIDKINPDERKRYLESNFWNKLMDNPFGYPVFKFNKNYYVPNKQDSGTIEFCDIYFGNGGKLRAPEFKNKGSYKEHFNNINRQLEKSGCYFVPPTLAGSKIYFVFPNEVPVEIRKRYSNDITNKVKNYLKEDFEIDSVELQGYDHYLEATQILKREYDKGMVVFVFDAIDAATYAGIDYELADWRIKRATSFELQRKYYSIEETNGNTNKWDNYIEMTTLDIIQQMGCIPYIIDPGRLNYDMQLFIDVSEDRTHFTLSLQIFRKGMVNPIFKCNTYRKTDPKFETINSTILQDKLIEMMQSLKPTIIKYGINSLLVTRDGNDCKGELEAIKNTISELQGTKFNLLPFNFKFDYVEYHKSSRKGVRLWYQNNNGVLNVLEGSYAILNNKMAVMAVTGEGTLNQGTADPVTIIAGYTDGKFAEILNDIFLSSQFNFSSPRVAQKLTLIAERADKQLIEKRAQEIKLKN